MKSVNHKSKTKSTQSIDGEFVDGVFQRPPPPALRPHCGIWAEPGRVEVMFSIDPEGISYQHIVVEVPSKDGSLPMVHGQGAKSIPLFATVEQAAHECGFKPKTFYNWIETDKLRSEHGVRRFGNQIRIEWRQFKDAVDRGEIASCS